MLHDIAVIFYCWFLSSLWLFISLPFVTRFTKQFLNDYGWGLNRTISWLLIGLPVWYLAHLGIPINTKPGIWCVFLALIAGSIYFWKKTKFDISQVFAEKKSIIIAEEVLFLLGFSFLSIVRGYSPEINSLEKFMDGGLIISYIKSPVLPIEDMWLAGMNFNYYTFGHFQGAVATQFWSIDPVVSYNILLGLLMGLSLQLSCAIIFNILSKLVPATKPIAQRFSLLRKIFPHIKSAKASTLPLVAVSLIGAYLLVFAGNTQTIWYLLARCDSKINQKAINYSPADENAKPSIADECSFVGYWYPNATRFIPRTIHEFPSYSFIVSDLHAHVWNIVHVLLLMHIILIWGELLLLQLAKKKNPQPFLDQSIIFINIVLGLLMGICVMTSTWDALVYSLFFTIISLLLIVYSPKLIVKLIASGMIIVLVMVISSSPWWLNFDSISEGVAVANEHSELWQLFVLWFAHVSVGLIGAISIMLLLRKKEVFTFAHIMTIGLVISGMCLIIIPEFAYVKDIYTTQPRANTMFKLTYQAFIQLSVVMAITLGLLLFHTRLPKKLRVSLSVFVIMIMICIGIYPYFGYRDYYLGSNAQYNSLDGLLWLKEQYPNDYQAYLWLKNIEGRPHIIEAVGDSYTTFNRISTFTGLPTVLGWRVHEWLWRGSYDIPGKRSSEVESIYLNPLSEESQRLLNQYRVKYVIVGDKEHEAYTQLNPADLKKLGKVVFEQGDTFIVER